VQQSVGLNHQFDSAQQRAMMDGKKGNWRSNRLRDVMPMMVGRSIFIKANTKLSLLSNNNYPSYIPIISNDEQ